MTRPPFAILFVCLGNICRSPLAEGAFRHVAAEAGLGQRFHLDSAGIGGWHAGAPPDRRAIRVAAIRGFDISGLRARQVIPADFDCFDLILAMDRDNLADLHGLAPAGTRAEVALYRERAEGVARPVPDPYYGTLQDFEAVCRMVEQGSHSLLASMQSLINSP